MQWNVSLTIISGKRDKNSNESIDLCSTIGLRAPFNILIKHVECNLCTLPLPIGSAVIICSEPGKIVFLMVWDYLLHSGWPQWKLNFTICEHFLITLNKIHLFIFIVNKTLYSGLSWWGVTVTSQQKDTGLNPQMWWFGSFLCGVWMFWPCLFWFS